MEPAGDKYKPLVTVFQSREAAYQGEGIGQKGGVVKRGNPSEGKGDHPKEEGQPKTLKLNRQ